MWLTVPWGWANPHDTCAGPTADGMQFEKILVINLPSRRDKRDAMSLAAALTGLQLEYIDGAVDVEAKTLPPGGADSGRTPGELGNWRAHMDCLQRYASGS